MIRAAREADLDALLVLCAEHAEYERASFDAEAARRNLGRFLFGDSPRVWCVVVEVDGAIAGYATYSLEFSTWRATELVHMDCLFVRASHRNRGLGSQLMQTVIDAAHERGTSLEWQTPSWNADAIRFYDRLGATRADKARYRLQPQITACVV
jgi:GNAT superfamily N-acetyltransferase